MHLSSVKIMSTFMLVGVRYSQLRQCGKSLASIRRRRQAYPSYSSRCVTNSMELKWKRSNAVPIPTVWARYESKKPMPNGRTPIFRIQDYTEDFRDQVISNMTQYFLKDEPIGSSIGVASDEACVQEFVEIISILLRQKMILIAVVENLKELGDPNLPVLAGCNITGVITPEDPHLKGQTKKMQKLIGALEFLESKVNAYEHYGVSEYLFALGLSVHPGFRGHRLGYEILKARIPLSRAFGIKASVTVFTSGAAQKSAEKAGFEVLTEMEYKNYKDENGEVIFKVDSPKSMKLMGRRIS